jgi:hypothetical protein
MAKITPKNIVVRETAVSDRGRPIVIELHPAHLVLRLKDLRDTHFVAYDALLWRVMRFDQDSIVRSKILPAPGAPQHFYLARSRHCSAGHGAQVPRRRRRR